jgi:hypothetical protein
LATGPSPTTHSDVGRPISPPGPPRPPPPRHPPSAFRHPSWAHWPWPLGQALAPGPWPLAPGHWWPLLALVVSQFRGAHCALTPVPVPVPWALGPGVLVGPLPVRKGPSAINTGGAELPLPAPRRQAPRWAGGGGWGPQGSLPDPSHLGAICEKSRFQDVKPTLLLLQTHSLTNRG